MLKSSFMTLAKAPDEPDYVTVDFAKGLGQRSALAEVCASLLHDALRQSCARGDIDGVGHTDTTKLQFKSRTHGIEIET